MHCELLAPGLFAAPGELRLPSLELLLARGRCASAGSQSVEAWLHEAFELGDEPLAAGALTLLGANGEPGERFWLWGRGRAPAVSGQRWQSLTAHDPLALGLARAACARHHPLPASATAWLDRAPEEGRHLLVLDALRAPLALDETGEYQERLAEL